MASSSALSFCEDDAYFTSQFAALIKPIRELTKHGCWELNIAEKLDEYVHYIQDLPIEVNVDGEQMKLDFAKAAMVVQNSVQIYSKKVENLWVLMQEVIGFLSSYKETTSEDPLLNPIPKLKKSIKKRSFNENTDLLDEGPIKFRKLGIKQKKKFSLQSKRVSFLPFGILQLEEAMNSVCSMKIKIFSSSNEHLGYPADLRSNFIFDNSSLFLSIHPPISHATDHPSYIEQNEVESASELHNPPCTSQREFDEENYDPMIHSFDVENELAGSELKLQSQMYGGYQVPVSKNSLFCDNDSHKLTIFPSRSTEIVPPFSPLADPWSGLEPYTSEEIFNKICGTPVQYKLPLQLQRNKKNQEANTRLSKKPEVFIDQYLGLDSVKKKLSCKEQKPDDEFWEDYVHLSQTIANKIGQRQQLKKDEIKHRYSSKEISPVEDEAIACGENGNLCNNDVDDIWTQDEDAFDDMEHQKSFDDSKQFFELVQQFMTEYTASAKDFVHSCESMKRVQAWHEMIQPRLEEAESRRDFDIHDYGTQIIKQFGTEAPIGTCCSFASLVKQRPKGEVARFFLATLQLANGYNIEISPDHDSKLKDVGLKLISRERHHERLEGFSS